MKAWDWLDPAVVFTGNFKVDSTGYRVLVLDHVNPLCSLGEAYLSAHRPTNWLSLE